MQDLQLEFFSHVVSADFDILVALLNFTRDGGQKAESSLLLARDYQCYAPDHHQYADLIADECIKQCGFSSYKQALDAVCAEFGLTGETSELMEHELLWSALALAVQNYTEEDFIRFALELRIQPKAYTFVGIKEAVAIKYAEKEFLPMYKIALCANALILGYFKENPCASSKPYESSLLELRSAKFFAEFSLFKTQVLSALSEQQVFVFALVLAVCALRKRDLVFYGRSGDSKAELIRKLKRFTVLLKTVPGFARSADIKIMKFIYAFNLVYLGRYNLPLPREMACEMLFGVMFDKLSQAEQKAVCEAEQCTFSLEEITKNLLELGITKDQMQDLIGVLALSSNKLIKIENIFIEWAVKLGLR